MKYYLKQIEEDSGSKSMIKLIDEFQKDPCITAKELAEFFKLIVQSLLIHYKEKNNEMKLSILN